MHYVCNACGDRISHESLPKALAGEKTPRHTRTDCKNGGGFFIRQGEDGAYTNQAQPDSWSPAADSRRRVSEL